MSESCAGFRIRPVQPCYSAEGPEPGAQRGKEHVDSIPRVADDRERREHVPEAAPACRRNPPPGGDCGREQDVDGIGESGRGDNGESNQRVGSMHRVLSCHCWLYCGEKSTVET